MCMRVVLTAVYLDLSQIVAVSHSVRRYVAEKTDMKAIRFITSYLLPPPKKAVLAFLGIPLLFAFSLCPFSPFLVLSIQQIQKREARPKIKNNPEMTG